MAIIKPSTAFKQSADWVSGEVRAYMRDQVATHVDTVQDVRDNDFEQTRFVYVRSKATLYRLDLSSGAADDGDTVLQDSVGRRYVKVAGSTISLLGITQVDDLTARGAYDNEDPGFMVLVSDTGSGRAAIYTMGDGGSGDWSDPAYLTGPKGDQGDPGDDGWTPVFAVVADGGRYVQQVVDWAGGTGTKPTTGQYVGPSGFVSTIGDAVNIRGASGSGTGDVVGPASSTAGRLAAFTDTTGKEIKDSGKSVSDFATAAQGGLADTAMQPATYDPTNVAGDVFDSDNSQYVGFGGETYAVQRSVQSALRDRRPSVTDYGVGAHGFEGAFGRALSAIAAETPAGNSVYLPAGLWTVEEEIVIGQSGVSLEGAGNGGTRIRNAQTDKPAITAGSKSDLSYVWRFAASDLVFGAADGITSVLGSVGLKVHGAADVRLSNIETNQFPAALHKGVVLEHVYLAQINRVTTFAAISHGQEYTDVVSLNFLSAESFACGTDGFLFRGVEGIWGQNVHGYENARNAFRFITHASRDNKNNFLAQWIGDTSGDHNWYIEDLRATDLVSCWGASQIDTGVNTSAAGFFMTSEKVCDLKFLGGVATNNNGNGVSLSAAAGTPPHTIEFHGFAFGVLAGNGRSGTGQGLAANPGCTGIRVFGGKANANATGAFGATGIDLIRDVNGYRNARRMLVSGTTDGSGDLTFDHGMDETPQIVSCIQDGTTAVHFQATSKNSTQVTVRAMDASGNAMTSAALSFYVIMYGARA